MARILYVSTSTTIGGAEKTLYFLATLLDPKRHQVVGVVSVKPEGDYARKLKQQGVKTESLDLSGMPGLADAKRLAEIIERLRPDIVHAVMYQAIQLCRLAKPKVPFAFKLVSSPRVHYRARSIWTLLVDRALKNRDDLLIAECAASRDFLVRRLGYAPGKVRTILNGIDLAGWPASKTDRRKRRMELRLGAGDLLVGAIGRLDKQKGFSTLIEAMARLKRTSLRCVILGEGPERARLEASIRRHELEKSVWLYGEQSDVAGWLSAFDIHCLPSLWEGLPNTLLEAMALGLPVVASAIDGVPEVVANGKNGVLVAPAAPAALAKALKDLAGDPARRAALGAAAHATIMEKFTLRRMMDEYHDAYAAVASTVSGNS
ncbi:MAG: glycosyltransferase [Elusimicrobia bacterium]|nr:glycosyltransferase [Elusimicrobiota bacterium]